MRRKILTVLAILSMATTAVTATVDKPVPSVNARASSVLDAYVQAHINNDAELFNQILNENAMFRVNRQEQMVQHSKKELIKFYKKGGKLQLNCTGDLQMLSECGCIAIARVDFTYPGFVQQNYVQIEKDKNGVWKITQINRFNT
jgi:hypothetical protein